MTPFQKTPGEVYADLLTAEAFKRDYVADAIARAVYGKASINELEPREAAQCRYAATGAIRRIDPHWNAAARQEAIKAADTLLAESCGKSLSLLPRMARDVIARILVGPITAAFFGVLEGSIPQLPRRYLEIAKPDQFPAKSYRISGGVE